MERTLSGVKKRGNWEEIVEFGEKVEASLSILLQENRIKKYSIELEDFRDWRPKIDDIDQEKDVHKKTAKQASVSSPETESKEELSEAKDKFKEATQPENTDESVSTNLKESLTHAKNATENGVKKQVQSVEEFVYENVMVQVSPTYFDNQLISASFQKSGDEFVFEVNINDDSLIEEFQKTTESLDETFSRWHIQMEETIDVEDAADESDLEGDEQETTTTEEQFTTLSEVKNERTRDKFLESQEFDSEKTDNSEESES
jgi:hypothetical protein